MPATAYKDSRQKILKGTFSYLVRYGLENTRIRALCKQLGLTQNALYYWFDNKEDLISQAALFGLRKVSDSIFDSVFTSMDNIDTFIDVSLSKIEKHKKELRSIYQMAASPVFGNELRKHSCFTPIYDKYAQLLALHIGGDMEHIKPVVYLFAASVLDYAIWEDKEELMVQLSFIKQYLGLTERQYVPLLDKK